MSEERELISMGCPPEDAITLCNSMRRTGELNSFMGRARSQGEKNHVCTCGGECGCKICPNRKDALACTE